MRQVHTQLDQECDGIMGSEYSLKFNKYVIDFCETTPKDQRELLAGVIHQVCGLSLNDTDEAR